MKLSHAEFEKIVAEALDSLPENFARLLTNIAVVVEDEPSDDDLEVLDDEEDDEDDDDSELLGIYRGTPMTERSWEMALLPDQIAIFRGPILRITSNRREAVKEIRETVIHELGHYFGLDDDELVF
jgi:predicted Zn-dependent protease with MMP-like domain